MLEKTVLFVDNGEAVLRVLEKGFYNGKYKFISARNGDEALQFLENEEIHLIIVDINLKSQDGYNFLRQVKDKCPMTLRLALGGYEDEGLIMKALQNNLARQYLNRQWDQSNMASAIDRVFQVEELLRQKELLALVDQISELPTLSSTYEKLCRLIENNAEIMEMADLIETDQSISAMVLHICNSAFVNVRTASVKQAMIYLGLNNIKNIVLSATVFHWLEKDKSLSVYIELLWQHAFTTNQLVEFFHEQLLHKKMADLYSTAGLLHDIGKVILLGNFPERYKRTLQQEDQDLPLIEAEKESLGIGHDEMGGYLLNSWELPYPVVEAVLFHHDPFNPAITNKELVSLVHLADACSWRLMGRKAQIKKGVLDLLEIGEEECNDLLERFRQESPGQEKG